MRNFRRLLFVVVLLASLALAGCSGGAETNEQVIVTGSTTVLPIAGEAAKDFTETHPDINVLVSGLGSSVGIESVATGTADVGTSSRDLKPEEESLGLFDTPIAFDGIAVIVHPSNPVKDLTLTQLQKIYAGEIVNWKEIGGRDMGIDLVNRDEASGTREAFHKIVMGDTPFDLHAAVLPGTGQVRDVVARSEGAVGYISVGFVESDFTKTTVKAVTVDGVEATDDTVASGEYPISRKLHIFTLGAPAGIAKEYIDYILSPDFQNSIIKQAGFVPITQAPPAPLATDESVDASETATGEGGN